MGNPRETISPIEKLTEAELEAYNLLIPAHKASAIRIELSQHKDTESDLAEVNRIEKNIFEQNKREPWKF